MSMNEKWRTRARNALEAYFRRRSFPRITLSLILALTGVAGLLISFILLKAGWVHMWMRYPVAVLCSYAVLLALIRVWVEIERERFDEADADLENGDDYDPVPDSSSSKLSSFDAQDLPTGCLDVPGGCLEVGAEGCLPVILIGVVVSLGAVFFMTVAGAPALVAEVFLDAFLVSVLYRRLKLAHQEHWLGTALRKTWKPVLLTALLLMIGGWALEMIAPESHSLGDAIEGISHPHRR